MLLRSQTEETSYFISSALEGIWLSDSDNTKVADAPSDNQVTKLDLNGSVKSSTVPLAGMGDSKSVRNIRPAAQALLCGGFPFGNAEAHK